MTCILLHNSIDSEKRMTNFNRQTICQLNFFFVLLDLSLKIIYFPLGNFIFVMQWSFKSLVSPVCEKGWREKIFQPWIILEIGFNLIYSVWSLSEWLSWLTLFTVLKWRTERLCCSAVNNESSIQLRIQSTNTNMFPAINAPWPQLCKCICGFSVWNSHHTCLSFK